MYMPTLWRFTIFKPVHGFRILRCFTLSLTMVKKTTHFNQTFAETIIFNRLLWLQNWTTKYVTNIFIRLQRNTQKRKKWIYISKLNAITTCVISSNHWACIWVNIASFLWLWQTVNVPLNFQRLFFSVKDIC